MQHAMHARPVATEPRVPRLHPGAEIARIACKVGCLGHNALERPASRCSSLLHRQENFRYRWSMHVARPSLAHLSRFKPQPGDLATV